jgi:hypothetical protein
MQDQIIQIQQTHPTVSKLWAVCVHILLKVDALHLRTEDIKRLSLPRLMGQSQDTVIIMIRIKPLTIL